MKPVLVNWTEFFMDSPIGGEQGLVEVLYFENLQMDPVSGMWKKLWSEIGEWTWLGELEDDLVGIFGMATRMGRWLGVLLEIIRWALWGVRGSDLMVKPGDFGHCRGDALRKCCHLALQLDEEGV